MRRQLATLHNLEEILVQRSAVTHDTVAISLGHRLCIRCAASSGSKALSRQSFTPPKSAVKTVASASRRLPSLTDGTAKAPPGAPLLQQHRLLLLRGGPLAIAAAAAAAKRRKHMMMPRQRAYALLPSACRKQRLLRRRNSRRGVRSCFLAASAARELSSLPLEEASTTEAGRKTEKALGSKIGGIEKSQPKKRAPTSREACHRRFTRAAASSLLAPPHADTATQLGGADSRGCSVGWVVFALLLRCFSMRLVRATPPAVATEARAPARPAIPAFSLRSNAPFSSLAPLPP
ncbi:hypothetical protein cyc_08675 [Cyclospora cayetanensis]|uniref:Uncharacterized protein n=1 Tax=Cyclospora cayetanensis TaxID=88456 RepID=A0A1D3CXG7_9EIME|nr:hypothetical protein cyc_08675 [Cyclospora cayetanensis]